MHPEALMLAALVGFSTLFACNADRNQAADVSAGPTQANTQTPGAASAAEVASSEPVASASNSASPPPAPAIPDMPSTPSARPSAEEWKAAVAVNTGDPRYVRKECEPLVLRDWVRIKGCATFRTDGRNNGRPGVDWFDRLSGTAYEMRMQPGLVQTASLYGDIGTARLTIVWPKNEPKPIHIALEVGAPLLPPPGPVVDMPAVPTEPSDVPDEAEWFRAAAINSAPSSQRPKNCEVRIVRNWIRAQCPSGLIHGGEGLGKIGKDYFTTSDLAKTEVIAPLKQGQSFALRFYSDSPAVLRASWSSADSQPTVSLELGI